MRLSRVVLCGSAVLLWFHSSAAGEGKESRTEFPLTYEGGSLTLGGDKLKAAVGTDEVVFVHDKQRISVPAKDITRISRGSEVHRRFGAAVLDVIPWLRLSEVEICRVGMTWMGRARNGDGTSQVEVVLRMSKTDYDEFLTALERLTGMKAIDTRRVPSVVRYDL